MSSIKEKILFNYHRVDVKTRPLFAPIRRLQLKNVISPLFPIAVGAVYAMSIMA